MQSPPPTEYFPGIQFNPYYYQSWYEPVTKLYVDTNFLKCVGYAYSRAIATSFSGIINADGGIQTTNINASGLITSTFKGSGAQLTSINASNISSGTLNVAYGGTGVNNFAAKRILIGDGTNPITTTANLIYDTSTNTLIPINIAANGSGLTNLNASNVSDGTLAVTRGGTGATNFTSGRILLGNGTSAITENGNLTWTTGTNTLNVTGTATATTMSATNIGIGVTNPTASLEIVKTTVAAITDIIMMKRDESNYLKISQLYVGSNDIKQIFFQLNAGVENDVLTFYKNSIGIGTTNPGLFKLDVGGTARATVLTAPTIGIGITNPTLTSLYILNTQTTEKDVIAMNYDGNNGLKIRQAYVAANDIKYTFYETRNNVITDAITVYKGSVGIGTTTPGAFMELDVVGTTRSTALTANNIGIGITNPTISLLDIVSPITTASDLINLRYNDSNGLKIQQDYVAVNDFKQSFVQRNNGGNTNILTFYKGNVGIGTTTPSATTKLDVIGNFSTSGTSILTGNVGIGTTNNLNNVLQVGAGGRLRIANTLNDYSLIGTADADGVNNTQIVLSGGTRTSFLGSIQYYASATGDHIFSTAVTSVLEKMTIKSGGNVGIGTTTPNNILHINDKRTNTTEMTIENSFTLGVMTCSPAPTSTGTFGIYSYMVLTYTTPAGSGYYTASAYTVTSPPGGLVCDVLMVGGGGAGGKDIGGGGGGGAVLHAQNVLIPAGQHNLYVGRGADPGESRGSACTGFGEVGFGAIVYGGSSAGNATWATPTLTNNQGASGGGGKSIAGTSQAGGGVSASQKGPILASATLYNGSAGGTGGIQNNQVQSAGGGGAAAVGGNGSGGSTNPTGHGGAGVLINIIGNLYWGGGGGGGGYITNPTNGGIGGGGAGERKNGSADTPSYGTHGGNAISVGSGMNGANHSGGGGGGGGYTNASAGSGGGGIIIIRWVTPISNSAINLITGVTSNTDYKIGNYNGNFSIFKTINNIDTNILTYYKTFDSLNYTASGGVSTNGPLSGVGVYSSGNMEATGTMYSSGNITTGSNVIISGGITVSGNINTIGLNNTSVGLLDFNALNQFDRYGQIRFGCGFWQSFSYASISFVAAGSVNDATTYIRHATNGYSRFDTYIISGGQQFPSDIRIKKNIQDINDDTALQLLLRIEPKSYDYIDIDKGTENVFGFIAQQVREVIPNAIKIVGEVLPNILEYGTYNNKIITFPNNTNTILKIGDVVRIDYKTQKRNWCEIINVHSINSFEIKEIDVEVPVDAEIYVYGTMVKDFHTVDKNYIYTLNVCATQELHRRMEAQNKRIKDLEEKIERLLTIIDNN